MSEPADINQVNNSASSEPPAPKQGSITFSNPPNYFTEALGDAERLLKYAAEMGIEIDEKTRDSVLDARAAVTTGWNETTAENLLAALTTLAAKLRPVSSESLRSFNTQPTVRTYWIVAIVLAVVIVPFSVASFITSGLTNLIRTDITSANDLAAKLASEFTQFATPTQPQADSKGTQPPTAATTTTATESFAGASSLPAGLSPLDAVTELQTFASLTRSVHARSRQLNFFIFNRERDPFTEVLQEKGGYKATFQLPVPLPSDLQPVVAGRISVFQDARQFGQDVIDDVSVSYGAISTVILPVLYALLGTCAYLLRSFSQEMNARTYIPSHSDSARFLIAGITGGVVGLFNNFAIGQGPSIPPLAIAFIVGYSVDVFFTFLEGLIQAFTKGKSDPKAPAH
jgi:hypothetical protein